MGDILKLYLDIDKLEHLRDLSSYNHNYYVLPYSIGECNYIYNECEEDLDNDYWHLGNIVGGRFVTVLSFYSYCEGNYAVIDLLEGQFD